MHVLDNKMRNHVAFHSKQELFGNTCSNVLVHYGFCCAFVCLVIDVHVRVTVSASELHAAAAITTQAPLASSLGL